MEIVLCIALIIVVSVPFLEKLSKVIRSLTNLVKQLHSNDPKGLLSDGRKIQLTLTMDSKNKKRNLRRKHKSHRKRLD